MNPVEEFENAYQARIMGGKTIPAFAPGDMLQVDVKVVEGRRERIQVFEGVCIARSRRRARESFTVRKNLSWRGR